MLKYLRIAVTVLSLMACVLLVVLWVRSYSWCDIAEGPLTNSSGFRVASKSGDVCCRKYSASTAEWEIRSIEMGVIESRLSWDPSGFYWSWALGPIVQVPHWFLLSMVASVASLAWIHWRFSLRTLLIATTLVAVVQGVIAASM